MLTVTVAQMPSGTQTAARDRYRRCVVAPRKRGDVKESNLVPTNIPA